MVRIPLACLILFAGLLPAAAQEPGIWRDPDQGCYYLVTPQGGIGIRYRRDGRPDCPDQVSVPRAPVTLPGAMAGSRPAPAAPVTWPVVPRPETPASRPPVTWPSQAQADPPRPRAPVAWPSTPQADGRRGQDEVRSQDAVLALGVAQEFNCWPAGDNPRNMAPVRVRVEPQAKVILVDASGGREVAKYTLDSRGDVWFNGRNERDPRLGIILSPSRGHMWLDSLGRTASRADVNSQPFECRPEGTVY